MLYGLVGGQGYKKHNNYLKGTTKYNPFTTMQEKYALQNVDLQILK